MKQDGLVYLLRMLFLLILFLIGYVFGSVPFGLVICRLAGYGDIRKIGSGGIGATNVLRTGNKALAFLTFLLDAGKGAIPIFAFLWLNGFIYDVMSCLTIGLGAIIGHNYPIWLKFKGGKGLSSTFGTFFIAAPIVGLIMACTWLAVAFITRISSLSALVTLAICPIATWAFYGINPAILALIIAVIGYIRHKDNIRRLYAGVEPKIGQK